MIYLSMETWFVYVKIENKKKKGKINRNYKSQKIITISRMPSRAWKKKKKQKRKEKEEKKTRQSSFRIIK